MALQTALENLNAKREAYDDAKKGFTRDKIAEALAPLIPTGHVVTWKAWIPGFNDGEPCTYSQGDVMIAPLVDDDDEEGYDKYEEGSDKTFSLTYGDPDADELHEAGILKKDYLELKKAWKLIPEEIIEQTFGYDVVVAIKPDGKYVVSDYYCGH